MYISASTFLEQIIEILMRKNLLKREHLELLVTPKLRTLNFMPYFCNDNTAKISQFLHLTSIRCSVRNKLLLVLFL